MVVGRSTHQSRDDHVASLLALEQARYELALFELSRPHRLAKALNKFKENPLNLATGFKELSSAVRSVPKPNPPETNKEFIDSLVYPLSLHSRVNTLVYPRIKVAVIGDDLSEFGTVAHTFKIGSNSWNNLLDFGVDLLVIYLSKYSPSSHDKYIDQASEHGLKIVLIKDVAKSTPKKFNDSADLVLSQFDDKHRKDFPFVDITRYNPINLVVKKGSIYTLSEPSDDVNKIGTSDLHNIQPNDVLFVPSNQRLTFHHHQMLFQAMSKGAVVVTDSTNFLGPAIVTSPNSNLDDFMNELNTDLELKSHYGAKQRREVVLNHSQIKRFEYVVDLLDMELTAYKPLVSIILSSRRPEYTEQILKYISTFERKHMDVEIVFIAHGDKFNTDKILGIFNKYSLKGQIFARGEETIFGDNLNFALEHASGDFVAKLDDDDLYGKNHLEDVLAAYYYSGADMAGKWSHWIYFKDEDISMTWVKHRQESFVMHLPGGTFICRSDFLRSVGGFGKVSRGIDSELYRRIRPRGAVLYSTHKYNYVRVRHGVEHTYDISHEDFKTQCSPPEVRGVNQEIVFT